MKTSDRLATILFLLAAPAARFLELKNNYDPAGLPTGGFPYLPAVLAAAAVVFLLSARGLPARDAVTADFGGIFRFDGQLTLTAAILGGFLLLAAAALRLVSGGMAGLELILSVFLACSGAALLYALIAQRRSGAFAPTALLVPVCFLVVQLIVTYRATACWGISMWSFCCLRRSVSPRSISRRSPIAAALRAALRPPHIWRSRWRRPAAWIWRSRAGSPVLPPASARRCCSLPIWRRQGISRGNNGTMPKTEKRLLSQPFFLLIGRLDEKKLLSLASIKITAEF